MAQRKREVVWGTAVATLMGALAIAPTISSGHAASPPAYLAAGFSLPGEDAPAPEPARAADALPAPSPLSAADQDKLLRDLGMARHFADDPGPGSWRSPTGDAPGALRATAALVAPPAAR